MKHSALAIALFAALPSVAHAEEPPVEVIVVGSDNPARPAADPTPAVITVDEDELNVPGRSAADTLAAQVGVQVTRRGGRADLATLSLRGSTNAQAPVVVFGMVLNDELTGTVDLSTLPLSMMHRVTVYRGHAPSSADELGLGGR